MMICFVFAILLLPVLACSQEVLTRPVVYIFPEQIITRQAERVVSIDECLRPLVSENFEAWLIYVDDEGFLYKDKQYLRVYSSERHSFTRSDGTVWECDYIYAELDVPEAVRVYAVEVRYETKAKNK